MAAIAFSSLEVALAIVFLNGLTAVIVSIAATGIVVSRLVGVLHTRWLGANWPSSKQGVDVEPGEQKLAAIEAARTGDPAAALKRL
ncbi:MULTISPECIES: hypothetical protein [unclassified Paraburkholderia]|uniref:hypothetical protein n=1 Tax=unclassified Paraburkholderia TaxID=2615204 RepID=UPI0038BA3331